MARIENLKLTRSILIGSIATRISQTDITHEWVVYVKPLFNDGSFISSVTFKLHETFAVNTITIDKPPFEVQEKGWGEFNVQIRINFIDINEKPLNLNHYLLLHDNDLDVVKSERYEEIVFRSPTSMMVKVLQAERKSREFVEEEEKEGNMIEKGIEMMVKKFEEL